VCAELHILAAENSAELNRRAIKAPVRRSILFTTTSLILLDQAFFCRENRPPKSDHEPRITDRSIIGHLQPAIRHILLPVACVHMLEPYD
jgi:hypothetical protein